MENLSAYLSEYYNHKTDLSTADQVPVTAGSTTPINTSLTKGGVITGKVTSGDTSAPLADVYVNVYDTNYNYQVSTTTDAQGLYTTPGLASGKYIVEFMPSQSGVSSAYVPQFYNKKATEKTADDVDVTAPNMTANINAVMVKGGGIAGNVLAADTSTPLENVEVDIYDQDGNDLYYAATGTDAAGNYSATGLPSGNYRVLFTTGTFVTSDYVNQYYKDKSSLAAATPIIVTAPSLVPGINAKLVTGGSISGSVFTQASNTPVRYVEVNSFDSSSQFVRSDWTDDTGAYQIPGLAAGSYRVHFSFYSQCNYYEDYYNKKNSLATADPVSVTLLNDTGNINGYLKIVAPPPVLMYQYLPVLHH